MTTLNAEEEEQEQEAAMMLRDVMSDITDDHHDATALRMTGSQDLLIAQDAAIQHQQQQQFSSNFVSPPPSRRQRYDNHIHDSPPPTFLSPFSSKARQALAVDDNDNDDGFQLSLYATRPVSIVVYVTNPIKTAASSKTERIPCVFPPLVAMDGKLSADSNDEQGETEQGEDEQSNSIANNKNNNNPPSPTTATLHATTQTRDLVIINPTAFGVALPNQVSLDILNSVSRVARISSEDWVRLYKFHQVWWPRGVKTGCDLIGTAMAHDVTTVGSIAQRIVIGMGNNHGNTTTTNPQDATAAGSPSSPLWGNVVHATVAQAFAHSVGTSRNEILQTYGLLGWILHQMAPRLSPTAQLTLSVLQVLPTDQGREEMQDLLQTKVALKPLALQHVNGSLTVMRLTQVPIDASNLKAVGHLMRRAWMACTHHSRRRQQQSQQRGHVVATLRLYAHASQVPTVSPHGDTELHLSQPPPAITLVDLAPIPPGPSTSVKRDATVRQTISVLGGVLRGTLLKAAGNHVAIPFRESLLTKVLQGVMDRPDCRTLLLSSISPLKEDYDRSMADLRYCSRILEKPGEAPKSPFDSLNSKGTSPTSQTSHSTTASEQRQRQIMLEQFDKKYHVDLLRNVTADPRQRFNRAGIRPQRQRVALATADGQDVETYIPPDYMDMDPGTVPLQPLHDPLPSPAGVMPRVAAVGANHRPSGLNTTFSLDSMERGSMDSNLLQILEDADNDDDDDETMPAQFLEPSPLATFAGGSNEFSSAAPIWSQENDGMVTDDENDDGRFDNEPEEEADDPILPNNQIEEAYGKDSSTRNADMDALSLELRQGGTAGASTSPTDSAMDNLSYELLHKPRRPEETLENTTESPIKAINPPTVLSPEEPVDWTNASLPSNGYSAPEQRNALLSQLEHSNHSEPPVTMYQQHTHSDYYAGHPTKRQYTTEETYNRQQQPLHYPSLTVDSGFASKPSEHVDLTMYRMTPRGATGLPSDIVVNPDATSFGGATRNRAPNGHTNGERELFGHTSAPMDTSDFKELQSVDSSIYTNLQASLNGQTELLHASEQQTAEEEPVVEMLRRSRLEPPTQRSFVDPPSESGDHQKDLTWGNEPGTFLSPEKYEGAYDVRMLQEEEVVDQQDRTPTTQNIGERKASNNVNQIENHVPKLANGEALVDNEYGDTLSKDTNEDLFSERNNQNHFSRTERPESPDFFPSDGSETQAEVGQLDSLLNNVRNKTKSRSVSISNDLTLIEQNQRTVVRRLVKERDNARRDLDYRTEEQRKESMRRERELRELRKSLEAAHSERQELEQIAEEAVTGREGLERRFLELERALNKKEQESVDRNDHLLLKDELVHVKQNLQERSDNLKKLQTEFSEQSAAISKMTIELQDLEQEKLDLQSRLHNEKSMIGKVEERNGKIQEELDSLRSQVIILENERNLLQSQMDSTKRSLQLSLDQKDGFAKSLSEQVEQLQIELQESQTRLWEREETVRKLEKELSANSEKIEKLLQRIDDLEQEVEFLTKTKDEIARELSAQMTDSKNLTEALRTVALERDDAERMLEESERKKNEAEAKIKRVEEETAEFRDEAERRLQTFFQRHQENESLMKDQESDMRALGDEKNEIKLELDKAVEENKKIRTTVDELRMQLDEVTNSRTTLSEYEQSEMQRLRASKNDLEIEVKSLKTQLLEMEHNFRLKAEQERTERLKAEDERDVRHKAELEIAEKRRIETERQARRQMENELKKARNEAEEYTRLQVEKARDRALEEAKRKALRETEEHRERLQIDTERKMQLELEREREKVRQESERVLREQLHEEMQRLRFESEGDIRSQLEAERERLRTKIEAEMQVQLKRERERLRQEVEETLQIKLDTERENLRHVGEENIRKRINDEREKLRLEAGQSIRKALHAESERLRREAEEKVRNEIEAERIRPNGEAEKEVQLQLQNQLEKLRRETENSARQQLELDRETLRRNAEDNAQRQIEIEVERLRIESEQEVRLRVEEERKRLQTDAERLARRQVEEEERERLRVETERYARRQADGERTMTRAEAERAARLQLDNHRERLRFAADRDTRVRLDRDTRRRPNDEHERGRTEADGESRIRVDEDSRRWAEINRLPRADMDRRLRLDSDIAERTRDRRHAYESSSPDYRNYDDYQTPRIESVNLSLGRRDRTPHDQDEYRRLEDVTVALAQALHAQSRTNEEDIAHLLRQFHAAEDAIVAHNRYFRTRIEGLRHSVTKR